MLVNRIRPQTIRVWNRGPMLLQGSYEEIEIRAVEMGMAWFCRLAHAFKHRSAKFETLRQVHSETGA